MEETHTIENSTDMKQAVFAVDSCVLPQKVSSVDNYFLLISL